MGKLIDLTDKTFGDLRVLRRYPAKGERYAYWLCMCKCGKTIAVRSDNLRNGHTRSCGCLYKRRK